MLNWTGSLAWTINTSNSSTISLFDNSGAQAKVENDSSGLVTINTGIKYAATAGANFAELNAVNGGITFGSSGTLTVSGSQVNGIKLFGSGQTINFNDTVNASNATNGGNGNKYFGFTTSGTGNTVNIGGTFNSGDWYVMNGGTLNLASGGSLTTTAIRLGGDFGNTGNQDQTKNGIFQLTSATGGQNFGSTINSVTGNTSGNLQVNSLNTSGTNTISGGIFLDSQLKISETNAGGTLALSGGIDVKGQLLLFLGGGTINVTSVIQNSVTAGASSVQIGSNGNGNTGNPTVTLSQANTYSGDTLVRAGALQFASGGTIDNSTIRLGSISGSATNASVNLINATGGQTIGSVFNPVSGNTGVLSINSQNTSGTNTLNNHIGMDNALTITQSAGGTLNITQARSGVTTNTGQDIKGNTLTFTPAANGTINDSGTIYNSTGTGNVVMNGAGTLTFSGSSANTYTGTTTVNSGTLNAAAAGALGSTSSVTVNSSGTLLLTGSGNLDRVNNSAGINLNGGTFARTGTASEGTGAKIVNGIPTGGSNSVGLGALTLSANSTLDFGSSGVGTLVFTSFTPNGHTLNILNYINSNANVATNTSGVDGTDDRLIFNQDESSNLGSFSFGGVSAVEIALGGGFWEITAVPEPSTWVAGALALVGLLTTQRRRITRLLRQKAML